MIDFLHNTSTMVEGIYSCLSECCSDILEDPTVKHPLKTLLPFFLKIELCLCDLQTSLQQSAYL